MSHKIRGSKVKIALVVLLAFTPVRISLGYRAITSDVAHHSRFEPENRIQLASSGGEEGGGGDTGSGVTFARVHRQ